jgi:hypothetical protein
VVAVLSPELLTYPAVLKVLYFTSPSFLRKFFFPFCLKLHQIGAAEAGYGKMKFDSENGIADIRR